MKNINLQPVKVVLLLFLAFSIKSYSQEKINRIEDSIKKYFYTDPVKAKGFSHNLLKITQESNQNNKDNIAKKIISYCYLSDFSNILNQKDSVLYFYEKAFFEAKRIKDPLFEIIVNINKANYFFNQYDYDSALNIYNQTVELASKSNDEYTLDYVYLKKAYILYELEKYDNALIIYLNLLKDSKLNAVNILDVKLGLTRTYIKLKKPDLAFKIINESINESRKEKLKEHEVLFQTLLGVYFLDMSNYDAANKTLNQSLLLAEKNNNFNITAHVKIQLSKLYTLEKEHNKSISLLAPLIENKNLLKENLSEIYYILGENYKEVNEMAKSSEYFSKFIESSKKIGQKKIDTIDHLNKIKISEIENREAIQTNHKKILVFITLFLVIFVVFILIKRKRDAKDEQEKFDILLKKIKSFEEKIELKHQNIPLESEVLIPENSTNDTISSSSNDVYEDNEFETDPDDINDNSIKIEEEIEGEIDSNVSFNIKDETISDILEKLIKLEERKEFLKQDFTLHKVAKKLKTNTAYLSKIVNTELNKSFSTYVNELRINYIILELKNNSKLRAYSIKAIGEEIGYKSPESFTKYFKIATGISPSVYIKKINKI